MGFAPIGRCVPSRPPTATAAAPATARRMRHTGAVLLAACLLLAVGVQAQRRRTLNDENFEHITQARIGKRAPRLRRQPVVVCCPWSGEGTHFHLPANLPAPNASQAATGQTTGIWFVNFCSPSARACKELAPEWEALGKELLQSQVRAAGRGCLSSGAFAHGLLLCPLK